MEEIWDFLKAESQFTMYWNLSLKSPRFIPFGANVTQFVPSPAVLWRRAGRLWRHAPVVCDSCVWSCGGARRGLHRHTHGNTGLSIYASRDSLKRLATFIPHNSRCVNLGNWSCLLAKPAHLIVLFGRIKPAFLVIFILISCRGLQ